MEQLFRIIEKRAIVWSEEYEKKVRSNVEVKKKKEKKRLRIDEVIEASERRVKCTVKAQEGEGKYMGR